MRPSRRGRSPRLTSRSMRLGLLALALAGILAGCSVEDATPGRVTELPRPEHALSEALMIALGQAKNYHHKADVYLRDGKPELAERALLRLLDVPFPHDSPEADDVRLDARARLATLRLGRGALDEALEVVREGLEDALRDSFFLANLHTVRGEIYEARAEALDAAEPPDREGARHARRQAIEAYARSIAINERLQERLMREGAR
jgi:tetratricopeptide (TPR) repeat protein